MVLLVPGELLPCADVPLDDGDDGVVNGHPAIDYAVVPSSKCLTGCTTVENVKGLISVPHLLSESQIPLQEKILQPPCSSC